MMWSGAVASLLALIFLVDFLILYSLQFTEARKGSQHTKIWSPVERRMIYEKYGVYPEAFFLGRNPAKGQPEEEVAGSNLTIKEQLKILQIRRLENLNRTFKSADKDKPKKKDAKPKSVPKTRGKKRGGVDTTAIVIISICAGLAIFGLVIFAFSPTSNFK